MPSTLFVLPVISVYLYVVHLTFVPSKLPRNVRQHCGAAAYTHTILFCIVCFQQVAGQKLRPNMPLRARKKPKFMKSWASRNIVKLLIVHVEAEVGHLLQTQKADTVDAVDATGGSFPSQKRMEEQGRRGGRESSKQTCCHRGNTSEVVSIFE